MCTQTTIYSILSYPRPLYTGTTIYSILSYRQPQCIGTTIYSIFSYPAPCAPEILYSKYFPILPPGIGTTTYSIFSYPAPCAPELLYIPYFPILPPAHRNYYIFNTFLSRPLHHRKNYWWNKSRECPASQRWLLSKSKMTITEKNPLFISWKNTHW